MLNNSWEPGNVVKMLKCNAVICQMLNSDPTIKNVEMTKAGNQAKMMSYVKCLMLIFGTC